MYMKYCTKNVEILQSDPQNTANQSQFNKKVFSTTGLNRKNENSHHINQFTKRLYNFM